MSRFQVDNDRLYWLRPHHSIISVLQISISKAKTVISERTLLVDRLYTVISGPHSIIPTPEATMSTVETIISATDTDFSKADTIVSVFLTSFFAAETVSSAAEKTAGAVPAGVFLNHQPGGTSDIRGIRTSLGLIEGRMDEIGKTVGSPGYL